MDNRAAFAFAAFAASTLQERATAFIDRHDLDAASPLLARSLERFEQAETVAPRHERTRAQLHTAEALHEIGIRVVRTGRIEAAFALFDRSMRHYAAALNSSETREERVEARFGTTLCAIALHHSRRNVSDRWFSVGTLARPGERAGFYNRLSDAAAAHRVGGDVAAAIHAEGLARSVEATSPTARVVDGRMTIDAVETVEAVAAEAPARWATDSDARRTSHAFQSNRASSASAA